MPPLTARLHALTQAHGLTLNALVMGAWAILLHRYSGEEDVVFGATRACRKSSVPDADETIGLFINTVPVRVALAGEEPALAMVKRVRQQWLEMRPYEHTPLARVKAVSQVPPSQPLFETLLVFENYRLDTVDAGAGRGVGNARSVELHELTNFPVTLAAYDGDELSFKIEFDRRRLDDETVARMLGHLHALLAGIASGPDAPVRELPLLPEAERRWLVEDVQQAPAAAQPTSCSRSTGGATLHELFEAQVGAVARSRRPDLRRRVADLRRAEC